MAALATAVMIPFVVATVRALGRGWLAVGDNGNFLIRSRDVLTAHHPLLGTWSSASIPLGENVNHPGPLIFDIFAVPAKLGGSGGLAVGVLLLHVGTIALVALFAWRAGGLRLAAASLGATAALAWAMGSELLYDPWQPHALLFSVVLTLVLVVAMARGDLLALPVAAAVASLVVQTHLSYTLLVPPLAAWGLIGLARRRGGAVVGPMVAAGVVVLACWAQPVADQVNGEGNLGALVRGVGTEQQIVGGPLGARVAADVLATPPWWARDSFATAVTVPPGQSPLVAGRPNIAGLPSGPAAVLGLLVVAVALTVGWVLTRRRRDHEVRSAVGVVALALVVAVVVTVRLPVGGVGMPPHQVRYLWPVSAFATGVLVLAVAPRRWGAPVLAGAAVGLAGLTLPAHAVPAGPQADREAIPVVRELRGQLGSLEDEGTVLYDTSELRFAEPWTSALMAAMQERGVDFTVDDPVWARQLGSARADDGDADVRVFVREGDAARAIPGGVRRIAFVGGLQPRERRELAALERALADLEIELNDHGRAAVASGALVSFADRIPSADELLAFGELAALVREGLLAVPEHRRADLDRYADLRHRWDRHTVAIFLDPTPYASS